MDRKIIKENIRFNTIKLSKFKTTRISIFAYLPHTKENAHLNFLLSKILIRSCKKYPDFTVLSKKLSSLYGASLGSSVGKVGDNIVIGFHIAGIDDRYTINKEILSSELSDLLCDILFDPNVKDNRFNEDDFNQAKRETLDAMDADFSEKRIYANQKAISIMCKDEAYGIPKYGTKEEVEKSTSDELYIAWQNMIKNARFEIFYTGDSDSYKSFATFSSYFENVDRDSLSLSTNRVKEVKEIKRFNENMPLSQSKMILGFRTCDEIDDRMQNVTRLMSAVLGGTANSKLFNNVREKLSLCYYCMSRYDRQKGIMLVESGVEKDNIEKAKDAILNEIEDMKKGNISDFELDSTKLALTNIFKGSMDLSSGVESFYSAQSLNKNVYDIEQLCDLLNSITKEEIVEAANRLKLDTIYTLTGEGEENAN